MTDALSVRCPVCGARRGSPCSYAMVVVEGEMTRPHTARTYAAGAKARVADLNLAVKLAGAKEESTPNPNIFFYGGHPSPPLTEEELEVVRKIAVGSGVLHISGPNARYFINAWRELLRDNEG